MSESRPQPGETRPEVPNAHALHGGHTAVISWLKLGDEPVLWCAFAGVLSCGLIVHAVMLDEIQNGTMSRWWAWGSGAVFSILAVVVIRYFILPVRAQRRLVRDVRRRALAASDPGKWREGDAEIILAGALCDVGIGPSGTRSPRTALKRLTRELDRFGIRTPGIIFDARIASEVLAIERTEELVEPEPVESEWTQGQWLFSACMLVLLVAIYVLTGRKPQVLAFLCSLVIFDLAYKLVWVVRHGLGLRSTGMSAGVGYLELPNGARIGLWEAVTLVTRDRGENLRVRLLAPDRTIQLKFTSAADPGFVAFWQRWNHPHPRPELLESKAR